MKTMRAEVERLLGQRGWKRSGLRGEVEWVIPGIGLRPEDSLGHAGSLLGAVRQQLEREVAHGFEEAQA